MASKLITPQTTIDHVKEMFHPTNQILVMVTHCYASSQKRIKVYQADENGIIYDWSYNVAFLLGKKVDYNHGFKLNCGYNPGQYVSEAIKDKTGLDLTYQTQWI